MVLNGGYMTNVTPIPPPARRLLLLEGRALLELAALVPAYPVLRRAPVGDGHAVLVLPGLMASDFSTRALRRFLRDKGYQAHGWKQGRNLGPSDALIAAMVERLADVHRRSGRRVSLIGWSLGGIYARELARAMPDLVRQVIYRQLSDARRRHLHQRVAEALIELAASELSDVLADEGDLIAGHFALAGRADQAAHVHAAFLQNRPGAAAFSQRWA
jgi:pimeloyl-ACP methyl ester carboxylesterase